MGLRRFGGVFGILVSLQVEDSGFWGSHLNRAPKIPGKSRSRSARPGISVEFYGMKLKAKLGMTGKVRNGGKRGREFSWGCLGDFSSQNLGCS